MQLIRDIQTMTPIDGSAVCMGNFDGMHLGHRYLLDILKAEAEKEGVPSVVILFEPHPLEFFQPQKRPARLMRLQDKLIVLAEMGIDIVICLRFNKALASRTAEQFIEKDLVGKLHMRVIIAGQDCRFGHQRQGDLSLLTALSNKYGYRVIVPEDLLTFERRVSSTDIRQALQQGDCKQAAKLLGRPFGMIGRVIYGAQLGRELGFPTANIACHRKHVPLSGVFAVEVRLSDADQLYHGVAHIAKRHIMGDEMPLLEVFLFGFNQSLYGQRLTVYFLHKIRDTLPIDNLEQLKAVIEQDVRSAQDYFALNS